MSGEGIAITRYYVTMPGGAQAHCRVAGEGPPLIVLHPSPQHSAAMVPAITAFAEVATVIALDTPGYGLSDDWVGDDPDMDDYARAVLAFADQLGIADFCVYGAATGAQVAIALAKMAPERLILTMLDSNGHFDEADRERMLQGYFPDVTPRRDGAHLATYWDMCRSLFTSFPWASDRIEDRLPFNLFPAEMVHQIMLRYFDVGASYAKAYRPAFFTETRAHLDGMRSPSTMMRWEGSPVLACADALIARDMPECITVLRGGPTLPDRYGPQIAALRDALGAAGERAQPFALPEAEMPEGPHRLLLAAQTGQLHARRGGGSEGRLLIMLHEAGASSAAGLAQAEAIAGDRPILAIDLSGHGHSDRCCETPFLSLDKLARPIAEGLSAAGLTHFDFAGAGLGGAVAAQLLSAFPDASLTLIDPTPLEDAEQADLLAYGLPDLTPKSSGAHLAEAWWLARDIANYWPHQHGLAANRRKVPLSLAPADLHARCVDMLRLGSEWREVARLEAQLAWDEVLAPVASRTTIAISPSHPCPDRAQSLARRLGTGFQDQTIS